MSQCRNYWEIPKTQRGKIMEDIKDCFVEFLEWKKEFEEEYKVEIPFEVKSKSEMIQGAEDQIIKLVLMDFLIVDKMILVEFYSQGIQKLIASRFKR